MEHFYLLDIRLLPDPAQDPASLEGLSEQRRNKCLWYLFPDDRKRALGAGRIIQRILQDTGCSAASITVGKNGKPEVDGCYFNVSHSGHYVIGVTSDAPIGCDIEEMSTPLLETAEHYFYRSERDYISMHEDKALAFWQLWTLKESYMKMTGEGMTLPLDQFEVVINDPIELYRNHMRQDCTLRHMVYDRHSIAICIQSKDTFGRISWKMLP